MGLMKKPEEKSTVKRARNRRMKLRITALEETLRVTEAYLSLLRHRAQSIHWGTGGMPEMYEVDQVIGMARQVLEASNADAQGTDPPSERPAGGRSRGFHEGTSN